MPLVKVAQNDPLNSSSQGGQQDEGGGVVLHVQDVQVYQSTLTFRRRVTGYQE